MKVIASWSGGKDSTAAIISYLAHGGHIDEAVYCRVMFNDTISAEHPEHENFIHRVAIPKLESWGIPVRIVQAQNSYVEQFITVYRSGKHIGEIYGFPLRLGPWCNSKLKIRPLERYFRTVGEYRSIVGIAYDEGARAAKKTMAGKVLPLVDYKILEADTFDICRAEGLLSPAYEFTNRLGCWFCHNQRVGQLKRLYKYCPELWAQLEKLDGQSPCTFRPKHKLQYYSQRFAREVRREPERDLIELWKASCAGN